MCGSDCARARIHSSSLHSNVETPVFDAVAGDVRPLPKGAVPPASRLPRRPWWQRLLRRDEG